MITKVIESFYLLKAYFSLTKDPNQLEMVFQLSDKVGTEKALGRIVGAFEKSPQGREALQGDIRLGKVDLNELMLLPTESLGYQFAKHMKDRNLNLDAIPTLTSKTPSEYVKAHLYETHDILHVVTGFDTDVAGELGLQAFYLGQLPTVLAGFLLSAGLLNTVLYKMDERERRLDEIIRGLEMGRASLPVWGVPWKDFWTKPLTEVRQHFGIKAAAA